MDFTAQNNERDTRFPNLWYTKSRIDKECGVILTDSIHIRNTETTGGE